MRPSILMAATARSSPRCARGRRQHAVDAAPPKVQTATNGYIDSRFTYAHVLPGLIPTNDIAGFTNLTEANLQLRLTWGDKAMVLIDASLHRAGRDRASARSSDSCLAKDSGTVTDSDVPAYESTAVLSEAYALYNFTDHLNLTLGKKRMSGARASSSTPRTS